MQVNIRKTLKVDMALYTIHKSLKEETAKFANLVNYRKTYRIGENSEIISLMEKVKYIRNKLNL